MAVKKVPMRLCVALNEPFPKNEMFRIVRTPEGNVIIDLKGKQNGHGAYLSKSEKAILLAKSKKILDRKLEVKVNDEIYDELLKLLGEK